MSLAPLINVSYVTTCWKIHFLSNLWALKTTYQMRIWLLNILSRHDFFCQYFVSRQLFIIWNSKYLQNSCLSLSLAWLLCPSLSLWYVSVSTDCTGEKNSPRVNLPLIVYSLRTVHILRNHILSDFSHMTNWSGGARAIF